VPEHFWPVSVLSGLVYLAVAGSTWGTENKFDGVYIGKRVLTKGEPQLCPAEEAVSVTVNGHILSFTNSAFRNAGLSFNPHPDGAFNVIYTGIGGGTVSIQGRIVGDILEADVTNGPCKHHWHLTKEEHG
jgi:hypothetical protein